MDDGRENRAGGGEEFPLEAFTAVYEWIGNWAEEACDPEQRVIAKAAYDSLTAVGVFIRDAMRQMKPIHDAKLDEDPDAIALRALMEQIGKNTQARMAKQHANLVNYVRSLYSEGKLPDECVRYLESNPGWTWD